jgi:hypothetical protein
LCQTTGTARRDTDNSFNAAKTQTFLGTVDMGTSKTELPNGTAPTGTDCDAAGEAGRVFIDTDAATGRQVYVCEGVTGWVLQGSGSVSEVVNPQTGASYTYLTSDCTKLVRHTLGTAIAGTLPSSATFPDGCVIEVLNTGAGTLTITTSTSIFKGGGASIILYSGQYGRIIRDGADWSVLGAFVLCTTCAGAVELGPGTARVAISGVGFQAPTSVTTPFMITTPAAPTTGFGLFTGTADPSALSFVGFTGSGNVVRAGTTIVDEIYLPLAGWNFALGQGYPSGLWDFIDGTTDATISTAGSGTVAALGSYHFANTNSPTILHRRVLPALWTATGGVDFSIVWVDECCGSGNVKWIVDTGCAAMGSGNYAYDSGSAGNISFNASSNVTTASGAGGTMPKQSTLTGLTITNCAAGSQFFLRVARDNTVGSNMAGPARAIYATLTIRKTL